MATAAQPETRFSDSFFDHVAAGCVWTGDSLGSTRAASMTAGVAFIGGKRLVIAAVTARTFTASKDTYIDLDTTGTPQYTEVANNAASPALTAGYLRIGIIVTGATTIAAAGSVNQGQETMVLPIASSIPYAVTDSLGNLICPRDPNRKVLGYKQIIADYNTTSNASSNALTGLSASVTIPAGRTIKITAFVSSLLIATTGDYAILTIWDGTVGSGTQLSRSLMAANATNAELGMTCFAKTTPSAGAKTYNVGLYNTTGARSLSARAGSTYPASILVELA